MRTRRWIALFLTVVMLVSGDTMYTFAQEIGGGTSVSLPIDNETTDEIIEEDVSGSENIEMDGYEGKSNNITWSIDDNGCLTISGSGNYYVNSSHMTPWGSYSYIISSAKVTAKNMTDCSYMFSNCENLISVDFSEFDTSSIRNMSNMFNGCKSLSSLNLSTFDTGNVTDMESMFFRCFNLTDLDLGSFDTQNVTNMHGMFFNCLNLASLNLSNFNTGKVTDTSWMFYGCSKLRKLDLSNFNASAVLNMQWMFGICSELISLDLSSFNSSKVTDTSWMFYACPKLSSLNLSTMYTENVTNMEAMFHGCSNLTKLNLDSFKTSQVKDMGLMFYGCSNLKELDLASFDTSSVRDFHEMFGECSSLTNLDLSTFNTSKATDISLLFYRCSNLESVDLSSFITNQVTDMREMFEDCSNLSSLDLSSFNAAKVIYTNRMFEGCSNLSDLYTPNYPAKAIELPAGTWQDKSGNIYTDIEYGLKSVHITKMVKTKNYEGSFRYVTYKGGNKVASYNYECDFGWFFNSPSVYNHELAKTSLKTAMAAFGTSKKSSMADNIKKLMSDMEFHYTDKSIHYTQSLYESNYDDISSAIGSRKIECDGQKCTLILVALRGAGYEAEWGGNFNVGNGLTKSDHNGFDIAANKVIDRLKNYILDEGITGNIKIWTVGYSRAAATANLVAAKLDDKAISGIDSSMVYAYCFECPKNTTNIQANSSKYNNIFNIVNQIDLVPMVAPEYEGWYFRRYGITYELPAFSNTSNPNMFYKRNDTYIDIISYLGDNCYSEFGEISQSFYAQDIMFETLVESLSSIMANRLNYALFYQPVTQDIIVRAMATQAGGNIKTDMGEIASAVIGLIIDISVEKVANKVDPYRAAREKEALLKRLGKISGVSLLNTAATHRGIENIGDYIAYAHYPELCFAWMESLDGNAVTKVKGKRKVYVNCPVDITVTNSAGNIVGQIINDEAKKIEDGIIVYVDDGQKVAVLPMDGDYDVQITATADGEMTCTVAEFIGESTEANRVVNYSEVQITEGESFDIEVESIVNDETGIIDEEDEYELVRDDGTVVEKTFDASGEEVTYSTITTASIGNGYTDLGGRYLNGEFAQLSATTMDGEKNSMAGMMCQETRFQAMNPSDSK